jgi:tetratricopeptide (TPR) repeat protein
VRTHAGVNQLARELDVHFLLRGSVAPVPAGYEAELLVVDGENDQAIERRTVAIPAGASIADVQQAVDEPLGALTYKALEVEVRHARQKPDAALDERDLAFRAYIDWGERKRQRDEKGAYTTASQLLDRAATIAPNDSLVLFLTAQVNLCDCVEGWSTNVEQQQALGSAALDKYLRRDPRSPSMLSLKADLYALRGRFEESALIIDDVLKREPRLAEALVIKAYDELKLGRPAATLALLDQVRETDRDSTVMSLAAAAHYALAQYAPAADRARKAMTGMEREELRNRRSGAVALTLVAAEAELGHRDRARQALADFAEAVPHTATLAAIRQWMHPAANLSHYAPLYDGLRVAGVPD